ncbi:hypothetical protein HK096_005713 [Nowakowskiella sp. JEL0078]|nr:hypothetical protein HK096_005713 [Nowakowskiella sp. JEL0078]
MATALTAHPVLMNFREDSSNIEVNNNPNSKPTVISMQTVLNVNSKTPPLSQPPSSSHGYQRALARVVSLEKTIEYLQDMHAGTLQGLHTEIARLQSICSGNEQAGN